MMVLAFLLIVAMLAALGALVYGVAMFLKNASEEVQSGQGPSTASLKSNKAMQYRIIFQGAAILIVVAILGLASMKS